MLELVTLAQRLSADEPDQVLLLNTSRLDPDLHACVGVPIQAGNSVSMCVGGRLELNREVLRLEPGMRLGRDRPVRGLSVELGLGGGVDDAE